jgi:diguanylate cyclase (GGDEF)-like protein/PAS domain S-box-containing protein
MPSLAQLMTNHADSVGPAATLAEAAARMVESRISSIIVIEHDKVLGIVTERDILRAMRARQDNSLPVTTLMSSPVHTVSADMDYREAYRGATLRGIRHLVVTDPKGKPQGIVTETDFRRHLGLDIFRQLNDVSNLMELKFPRLKGDATLDAALAAMEASRQSCVVVIEGGKPVGIVTERDVVRLFLENTPNTTLATVMTQPVAIVNIDTPINVAAQKMLDQRFRHLAVVDHDDKLVGLLTEHALLRPLQQGMLDDVLSDHFELGAANAIAEQSASRIGHYQRALLDNFPFLVWLKDTESRFLAVNQQFANITGAKSSDAMLGKSDLDYFPTDLADKYRADDAEVMAHGVKKSIIEQITTPEGTLWHETYKAPVFDSAGELLGTVGFARDISSQYRTEHAVIIRNAALAGLLRGEPLNGLLELIALSAETELLGTHAAIFLITSDNKHLSVAAAPSIPEEIRQQLDHMPIAENTGASGTAAFRQERVVVENLFTDPKGKDFLDLAIQANITSAWAEPIFSSAGELLGTFTAYHPAEFSPNQAEQEQLRLASQLAALVISEHRNAADLDLSLASFRGIFDSVDDALMILDAKNIILDANPRLEDLAGQPRSQLIGMHYRPLLADGLNPTTQTETALAQTLSGTPATLEAWGKDTSGRIFPIEVRMRPTKYFGQDAVIASIQDIGERKTAAQRLLVERDLADALARGQTREELFPLLLDLALRFPEFDCGGLYVKTPDGGFQLIEHRGLSAEFIKTSNYIAPGSANAVLLESGKIICSCDEADSKCSHPDLIKLPHLQGENIHCLAVLPIAIAGETVACLNLAGNDCHQISSGTYLALESLGANFTQTLIRLDAQAESQRLQKNLSGLFDALHDLLFIITPEGRILHYNRAVSEQLGYSASELINQPIATVHPPEMAKTVSDIITDMIAGKRKNCPLPIVRADGSQLMVETRIVMGYWDGKPAILGISQDISQRLLAEQRQRLAASVFDNAHEGIMITDPKGKIIDVNETFTELTGYSHAETIGKTADLLKSGHHTPEFYLAMWKTILDIGYWRGEIWNRKKTGEMFVEQLTISAVRDEAGTISHYVGIFTDITLIKEHQQRLEHLAHFDPLTQLPNRMLLADRMQLAMAQAERSTKTLAVCYLDLDGFKPVNDLYGHATGDRLLIEVAQRLKACVRAGDTVSRLGGDEFVLLLTNIEDEHECDQAMSRIIAHLTRPVIIDQHEIVVSGSIGITLYPQDESDADTLLRHADQAMYAAKQAGRNRYHLFDPEHDRRTRVRREETSRIRQGLLAGEFEMYYQPKVDMRQATVIGAEALIRWNHPELGLLPPAHFTLALESGELCIELGEWVLAQALKQLDTWQSQGITVCVSVNIAGDHLQHSGFVERLKALLAKHPNVSPDQLELEILETAALDDIAVVAEIFAQCRQFGVRFSLDDFGTGYSSLTYFRRLPADVLKIDQSFIRDMLEDPDDMAIVQGVIGLTHAFKRIAIAEGVETEAHGLALLELGCELGQGYGIARPMPADQLPDWIKQFCPATAWKTKD